MTDLAYYLDFALRVVIEVGMGAALGLAIYARLQKKRMCSAEVPRMRTAGPVGGCERSESPVVVT